jgi:hypothetical protein
MSAPGLTYTAPDGRFECQPASGAWLDNAPGNYMTALDLRVMEAHTVTALENIRAVLKRVQEPQP